MTLVASVVLSAVLVVVLLDRRGAGEDLLVDNSREVAALLDARSKSAGAPTDDAPGAWPPALVREPLSEEVAAKFYPAIGKVGYLYDPVRGMRRAGGLDFWRAFEEHPMKGWRIRTNALGLREDVEASGKPVDLCVLILGDSQTEGVCPNKDSYPNRLELRLRARYPGKSIEVWNAGMGGTGPYHYLATLEDLGTLEPDLVVAAFYGGNDFKNVMPLERYFHSRGSPTAPAELVEADADGGPIGAAIEFAELGQLAYFKSNPQDGHIAVGTCAAIALEMRRQCEAAGARFACVYLPPPLCAQPLVYAAERNAMGEHLRGMGIDLELSDRLADDWIALLGEQDLEVIDLRPRFAAAEEPLYWASDWHLEPRGNLFLAAALEESIVWPVR